MRRKVLRDAKHEVRHERVEEEVTAKRIAAHKARKNTSSINW